MDGIAKIFQKDYEDSNPKRLPLLISFFTLTKSLGRSLEMNKKIVSNALSEETDFFEKTGKLLINCDTQTEESKKLRLALIATIANFGLQQKEFVDVNGLLEKLMDIVNGPVEESKSSMQPVKKEFDER